MNAVGHEVGANHMPGPRSGRAAAVGHQAKAAVAAAREAGLDLPKNAQGFAASAIARGAEPESVFAALVTPPVDEGGGSTGDAPVDDVTAGDDAAVVAVGGTDAGDEGGADVEVDEVTLPPETVAVADEEPVEPDLTIGASPAEIALETLVSEELDEVFGTG